MNRHQQNTALHIRGRTPDAAINKGDLIWDPDDKSVKVWDGEQTVPLIFKLPGRPNIHPGRVSKFPLQ